MRTHGLAWAVLVATALTVFMGYWAVAGVIRVMDGWAVDLPSIQEAALTNNSRESTMYAADGTTLLAQFQLEKRDPVTYDQVSPYVIQGTVDTEDIRFYEHHGVDFQGIARAIYNNMRGGSLEGASTITQQLVRNTLLSSEATEISIERKIREANLALQMETLYSKNEILLMYLNTINYGDGCYGIEAAAQNYFQVSAADLTLTQAATLVGIPQSPTFLNPKLYPEDCLARRNLVLDRMEAAGDIGQEECEAAKATDLDLNPAPPAPDEGIFAYPYFTSYARELLFDENSPYEVSYADLFKGGLTIYTTLDVTMQQQAEAACAAQRERMAGDLESSLVAVDVNTGHVKALVGGSDYSNAKYNLATGSGGSGRQAGSTFKAFTLAAAIEDGVNPQTRIDCSSPMTLTLDGVTTRIENFDNYNYGVKTIQQATAVSSNTGFIRLSEAIGFDRCPDMAEALGVHSPLMAVPSTTLGTADVTPLDMARAYATLASGGVYRPTIVITKIVNRDGDIVYEAPQEEKRVISDEVAGATTKVLRTVFEDAAGTAYGCGPSNGQVVAGKTGTSEDFADHWLVGYTPYLSCATWIGNPAGRISTDPSITCNQLWKDFMSQACADEPLVSFPETAAPEYNNPFNDRMKQVHGGTGSDLAEKRAKEEEEKKKKEEEEKKKKEEEEEKKKQEEEEAKKKEDEEGNEEQPGSNGSEENPGASDPGTDPYNAPNVVGRTFDEAIELLRDYEAGYYEEHSDTVPAGTVISQAVEGNMVVITVSLGPE